MLIRIAELIGAVAFEIWYYIPHLVFCLFVFGTFYLWMMS
jgi:hypothetical protein